MSVEPLTTQPAPTNVLRGKPKHFTFLTLLVGVHGILGFAYFKPSSAVQLAAAIVVSAGMVYFFWKHNVAILHINILFQNTVGIHDFY
jgi:hypothetical protein